MEELQQIAIKAALSAGQAIMEVYDLDIRVEYKNDNSPLTEADKRSNSIISEFLSPTKIPIISEENKQVEYDERKLWSACWIVDPVDGTKEFVKRNGEFTVNIALLKNNSLRFGVIYVPAVKTLYFGNTQKGKSYKCILPNHSSNISDILSNSKELRPRGENSHMLKVVGSRSHMNAETTQFIKLLKNSGKEAQIVAKGSSLKFCLVAEGLADIYPRFAPTMEWDTAAGQAICEAVGLSVISQESKEPLNYNKENLLNPWFIVS